MTSSSSHLEIAVSVAPGDCIDVWDLQAGTHLKSFSVAAEQICMLDDSHFVITLVDKPSVQVWSWTHGAVRWKCAMSEKLSCFTVSHSGIYFAAGAPSGKIYMWNIKTGEQMRVWEAHFKKVTALRFTDDDSFLVSGAEDAVVNLWLHSQVLAEADVASLPSSLQSSNLTPFLSWSSHALPVTGICCGVGGISGRIFTCSLDRTVRVYDIAANCQVASFVLPVALHALALDAAETYAYAAGVDGRLFQIDLLAHARGVAVASNQNELPVYIRALIGHSKTATALSLSLDDLTLISSSLDGTCIVWDTRSGQAVRTLKKQRKSYCNVLTFVDGAGYFGIRGVASSSASTLKADPTAPAHLAKFATAGTAHVPTSVAITLPAATLASNDLQPVESDWLLTDAEGLRVVKRKRERHPSEVMSSRNKSTKFHTVLSSSAPAIAAPAADTSQLRETCQNLYRIAAAALL